eukprot:c14464_g2_i1 orf=2-217(-)
MFSAHATHASVARSSSFKRSSQRSRQAKAARWAAGPAAAMASTASAPAQSHSLQDSKAMCATISGQVASQLI